MAIPTLPPSYSINVIGQNDSSLRRREVKNLGRRETKGACFVMVMLRINT